VLLRILLIEADRASTPEGLAASIDTEESMCRMRLATTAQDLQRVSAGVGITLCAEIAGEMGGRLSFDSEPGRGVVFDLRLPLLSNP
jgi:C4-dicarboxylate-specific signal transduction histidine kinase